MSNNAAQGLAFPLPLKPDTWALNEAYLGLMRSATQRWDSKGYSWAFGLENNFNITVPETYPPATDAPPDPFEAQHAAYYKARFPERHDQDSYFTPVIDMDVLEAWRLRMADRLIAEVRSDALPQDFIKAAGQTRFHILQDLKAWRRDLGSEDLKARAEAVRQLVFAHLHILPLAEGGLREIIEPRFGTGLHGEGWYDDHDKDCEIRLRACTDPEVFIKNYHALLETLYRTPAQYGAQTELNYYHLHFSLWDKAGSVNLMRSEDPAHVELRGKALRGLIYLCNYHSALMQDLENGATAFLSTFDASSDRTQDLRQTENTWEMRLYKGSDRLHLARDLALLMSSMYAGAYMRMGGKDLFEFVPLEKEQKPVVENTGTRDLTGIVSTLSHCSVGDNGLLCPPPGVLQWNCDYMIEEIGADKAGLYTVANPDDESKIYDLSRWEGWAGIFTFSSYDPDRGLILPEELHPDIAAVFSDIRIAHTRSVFKYEAVSSSIGFKNFHDLPAKLDRDKIFRAIAGDDMTDALAAFYRQYSRDKLDIIAARMTMHIAHACLKDEFHQALAYTVPWTCIAVPTALQYHLNEHIRTAVERKNGAAPLPLSRGQLASEQNMLKLLAPVFGKAVDNEIAYHKAVGSATNSMISLLEDARQDIGDYSHAPDALLACNAASMLNLFLKNPDYGTQEDFCRHYRDFTHGLFMAILANPDIDLDTARRHINKSADILAGTLEKAENSGQIPSEIEERYRALKDVFISTHQSAMDLACAAIDRFAAEDAASAAPARACIPA